MSSFDCQTVLGVLIMNKDEFYYVCVLDRMFQEENISCQLKSQCFMIYVYWL